MGEDFAGESNLDEVTADTLERIMSTKSDHKTETEAVYKRKGFFGSFGLLLREQTGLWLWYLVL